MTAPEADTLVDVLRWRAARQPDRPASVSYTHLRAHETVLDLVCRLLLEKKKHQNHNNEDCLVMNQYKLV